MIKTFTQYNEQKVKQVVFTFGRFNPPTIGHGKLIAKVAELAKGNDYRIFVSQSNDKKKNPLEYKEKIRVMRKMFPKHGRNIIEDKTAITVMHIASNLYKQRFTKLVMVVGSDRISEFKKLLQKYNDVKGRHGYYNFVDGIEIVSAGERDPDSEGVKGMSASKMRQAVIDGDFKSFATGLPKEYGEDMTLFNLLRKRMGLKEVVNFRQHTQLPKLSEKRERYIAGEIFKENSIAYVNGEKEIVIKHRKSNYVISETDEKYFIHTLEEKLSRPYGKGLSKSTKAKRQAQFNKQAKMDDDDPRAYKPAPGDARAKTKLSKYTIAYRKRFGEFVEDDHSGPCWKTHKMVGMKKKKGYPGLVPNCVPREEVDEAEKRVARKKGQHTGSSSHSDLYTDEDPKGTIHGLGFKDAETAKEGIKIITKSDRTHAHKVQATLVMQQRAKVAIGRTKDPEKKANIKAAYEIWTKHLEKLKDITKQKNEAYEYGTKKSVDAYKKATPGQDELEEAEYDGRKVTLNKPFRSTDKKKKFYVYVKNDKDKIIRLGFGDPNMDIKRDSPGRLKSFRARHQCDTDPGPKWKARYWSCKFWEPNKTVTDLLDWYFTKDDIEFIEEMFGDVLYESTGLVESLLVIEKEIKGLRKKSDESGIAYGILKKVFDRGMAAWKTGHRPGATPHQWAFARVNSFITGGKTRTTADKDLWAKHKGKKESIDEGEGKYKGEKWEDGFKRRVVKTTKPEHLEKGFKWRIKGKERDEISIKLYKKKPDYKEFVKQMKRVAGHEFGG